MKQIVTISLLLFSLVICGEANAQKKELKKARSSYNSEIWYEAISYYEQAVAMGATLELNDQKNLAHSYYESNAMQKAFDVYSLMEENLTGDDLFYYASSCQQVGYYENAIKFFEKAKVQSTSQSKLQINDLIESCKWADNNSITLDNIRCNPCYPLAVQGQSFGVQYYKDKLVFSSGPDDSKYLDKDGHPVLNLYCMDVQPGNEIAEDAKGVVFSNNLLSDSHVGAIAFTSDYKYIYYTKTVFSGDLCLIKIFVAEFNGRDWTNEQELTINSNEFDCAHPALTKDDKYLYFTSNRPGGYGGKDIYYAERRGPNSFGKVINAGSAINTYGNEVNPVFNQDGKLYFSSDTHPGFGGLDIFSAEMIDGKWQNVTNLRKPYNSEKDDFCYVINPEDQTKGFLSSNRYGEGGEDVIFYVKQLSEEELALEKQKQSESIAAFDPDMMFFDDTPQIDTKPVEPEPIIVENPKPEVKPYLFNTTIISTYNGTKIEGAVLTLSDAATGASIVSGTTDAKGHLIVNIPGNYVSDEADYNILVKKEGYNDKSLVTSLSELAMLSKDGISLTPIFNDAVLDDISGMEIPYTNDLDANAKSTLDKLAAYLLSNPNIVVKLNGHTEAKGNRYGNLDVSQNMSEKAKAYVVAKGVNEDQMICRGYGERYLKNRCHRGIYCEKSQHAENRRIEVVVWNVRK